jgi:DNA-binding MarR family transcriptional regulator
MSSAKQFETALHEWAEVVMTRSMRAWRHYIRQSGLSMSQFITLVKLYHTGGCGISDISSHLDVTAAAASQLVDRLVNEGYLERVEDPHDRRAKQVTLSAKGRRLVETGLEIRNRWIKDLIPHLDIRQRGPILVAVLRLTEAARRLDPEG